MKYLTLVTGLLLTLPLAACAGYTMRVEPDGVHRIVDFCPKDTSKPCIRTDCVTTSYEQKLTIVK